MLRWNERQRDVLVDKLADAANIAAAGLLFGQTLGGAFTTFAVLASLAAWTILMGCSMYLARRGRR